MLISEIHNNIPVQHAYTSLYTLTRSKKGIDIVMFKKNNQTFLKLE